MNKVLTIFSALILAGIASCGPAAEDRALMYQRSRVFQDSIANTIRHQMAEAEGPEVYQRTQLDEHK